MRKKEVEARIPERMEQSVFEDPTMRDLHHMQKNMNSEIFSAYVSIMKKVYQLEHPEDYTFQFS